MATEKRLIDANAYLDVIKADHDDIMQSQNVDNQMKWCEAVMFGRAVNALVKMPTVDAVEVVHGHWVSEYEYDFMSCEDVRTGFSCNRCGSYYKKRSNYCPNCGAKMDGDGNA